MLANVPPQLQLEAALDDRALNKSAVITHRFGGAAWAMVLVWTAAVAIGMGALWQYEHRANQDGQSPDQWPSESQLILAADQPTLLFFAHPKCPCTRASIAELEQIMLDCQNRVRVYAIFFKPSDAQRTDWERTDLWDAAEQIPGVTAVCDVDGTEANRFNAATSGLSALYDSNGALQFSGGITSSRGHRGENHGRSAIVGIITQGIADTTSSPVYGCELQTPMTPVNKTCCRK